MAVYVLQFSSPLGNPENPRGSARYYVGWTKDGMVEKRIAAHRAGKGAFITQAAIRAGLELVEVARFPGDRTVERAFKNRKGIAHLLAQYKAGRQPLGLPAPLFLR